MWAAFDIWRETGAGGDLPEIVDSAIDVLASGLTPKEPEMPVESAGPA
jgi:hypothetical protein